MVRRHVLVLLLINLCEFQLNAQPATNKLITQVNAPIDNTGEMTNIIDGKSRPINYRKEINANENKTKYTISSEGIELYEVAFICSKNNDDNDIGSISIRFDDKKNDKVVRKNIAFNPEDSKNIVVSKREEDSLNKNEININQKKENYDILFSIDDKKTMFVTLYQFKAIVEAQTYFSLQFVSDSVLQKHRVAVERYERIMKGRRDHQKEIDDLKVKMNEYKDSVIDKIKNDEEVGKVVPATRTPDTRLQEEFRSKIAPFFVNYLKSMFPFNEYDIAVRFTFSCNGYNKLEPKSTTISTMNGNPIDWFKDTFKLKIQHDIEAMDYNTIVDEESHRGLKDQFLNLFKDRINKISPDRKEFTEIINQINTEFDDYLIRRVKAPTLYTYDIKYKSKVEETNWKLMGDGSVKPKDRPELKTPYLEKLFKEKTTGQGTGRYDIKICTISINDKEVGESIQIISKK